MTLQLRRKRQTTAREQNTPVRTAVSAGANKASKGTVAFLAPVLSVLAATILLAGVARGQDRPMAAYQPYAAASNGPNFPVAIVLTKPVAGAPQSSVPVPGSQVVYQPAMPGPFGAPADDTSPEYHIPLEPPGRDRIFRLDSEAQLMERMRQEARDRRIAERITFPEEPTLEKTPYAGRAWPKLDRVVEPNYVAYRRLLFQQPNFERYGWNLGPITPFICLGGFWAQCITAPYEIFKDPFRCYDSNAGYCLPGDPTPLVLYPPWLSASGALGEAAAVLAIVAIFP